MYAKYVLKTGAAFGNKTAFGKMSHYAKGWENFKKDMLKYRLEGKQNFSAPKNNK